MHVNNYIVKQYIPYVILYIPYVILYIPAEAFRGTFFKPKRLYVRGVKGFICRVFGYLYLLIFSLIYKGFAGGLRLYVKGSGALRKGGKGGKGLYVASVKADAKIQPKTKKRKTTQKSSLTHMV